MPVERLEVGQLVLVRPGDRVSADGVVEEGESDIDESPVTGESMPVAKAVGSPVFASEWLKTPEDVVPLALYLATQPDAGATAQSFSLLRRDN